MTTATPCKHRWRIEEPHDGVRLLSGRCKACGVERNDFQAGNDMHYNLRDSEERGPRRQGARE